MTNIGAIGLGLLSTAALIHVLLRGWKTMRLNSLLHSGAVGFNQGITKLSDLGVEDLKAISLAKGKQKPSTSLQDQLFKAGFFTESARNRFNLVRYTLPVITGAIGIYAGVLLGSYLLPICFVMGVWAGVQLPQSFLARATLRQDEEIMYYLPLVIEQLVVGVSSSLDVAPCIQRVVQLADERDSHNIVTELLRFVQQYVKSGVSFEEALNEVGIISGNTELKHTFMSLGQVVKHGGEITRQLQELADAVAQQRETKIEGRIKKLELEATGPVGLVFVGFMGILMIGIGSQMLMAFE